MGFPSPAKDYLEKRLTVNDLCGIDANSRIIPTDQGYAVLDVSLKPGQGNVVLIRLGGALQFAKIRGRALITTDGEAIESEALNDVEVMGVVTYVINDVRQDDSPV